jgi:hypothetical protein
MIMLRTFGRLFTRIFICERRKFLEGESNFMCIMTSERFKIKPLAFGDLQHRQEFANTAGEIGSAGLATR